MSETWVEFNINHYVRIQLTDFGRQVLRDNHAQLYRNIGVEPTPYREPTEDADGWSKWQAWEVLKEFGSHIFMGMKDNPFVLTIQIDASSIRSLNSNQEQD